MKNPNLAALLNLIPGLGYLYVGRRKLFGFLILLVYVAFVAAQVASELHMYNHPIDQGEPIPVASITSVLFSLAIMAIPVLFSAFMYDAYQDAKSWNKSIKGL